MNRTRSWMAMLTLTGSFVAASAVLAPTASAHTCSEDYVSNVVFHHDDCGGCEKGAHDHDYTLGPAKWDRCSSSCTLAAQEAEVSAEVAANQAVACVFALIG